MNAMEKVAWTELAVSVTTVIVVASLVPWLGQGAVGAFGLLGLLGLCGLYTRRRGHQVVVDERDIEIQRSATALGFGTAWMTLYGTLLAATLWAAYNHVDTVSIWFLNWLIWLQFALVYGIKGLVAIILYRRRHAS